jgi:hypothetical protein
VGLTSKLKASLKEKYRKYQEQVRKQKEVEAKAKAEADKIYWQEYEKAVIQRAREAARQKAREKAKAKGQRSSLEDLSKRLSTTSLLGPSVFEFESPEDLIWGKKKKKAV